MKSDRSRYSGYRFPPVIISYAVWAYHRFCLSFRDVEDLLAERGIIVSYETIRRWCQKFGAYYVRKWLPDPNRLLEGTGKFMRHVKLRPGAPTNAAGLRRLIDAAYSDM